MLKNTVKKIAFMLSISVSLITVLISYYVGIEKNRCWQAFILGAALWFVSRSIFTLSELFDVEINKKDTVLRTFASYVNFSSAAFVLPLIVVLPFMGTFYYDVNNVPLNSIGILSWIIYSAIFFGVITLVYIMFRVFKKR